MRTSIIATTAALSMLFSVPSQAASKSSKEEAIGVGSGSIVGAIAGGPVGFIIGAAIGAKVGDSIHSKNERIDNLQDTVASSNTTVDRLAVDIESLNGEIDRLQNVARPELVSLLQAGIAMDLLFRTDESVLATATRERLASLATTLAGMSDIYIQLDGFADERGSDDYNQLLSERRVQFIRDQLIAAGVHPGRINASAHGEAVAQDENPDSYALERRVSITLFIDNTPSLASNPH